MLSCLVGSPGGAEETEGRESSPGRRWSSQTAGLKGLSSTSIKRGLLNIMSQRTPNSQLPGSNRKSDGSSGTSPSNLSENGDLQHAQASRMEVDQGMQDSSSRDFKKEFVSADRPTGQEDMRKQWNAVGTPISRDKSPSMDVDQGGVTQGLPAFEIGLPAGTDGGAPPAVDSPGDTVMSGSREAEQALGVPMVTTPGTDFHGEGPEEAGTLLPLESRPADEELQAEGTLEDCLKLLRSGVDEQRLVGLLLATKFVSGGDLEAVNHIFHAIGFDFIDRLLQSAGYGEGGECPTPAYAQLAFGILSAFCRLPDLAAEPQLLGKVPLFVSVLKARGGDSIRQDVYECLLGVASASDFGFSTVKEEEAVPVVLADLAQSTQVDESILGPSVPLRRPLGQQQTQSARKHELSQDAGVLASVRLVGKYLAEAPGAHRKQVSRLLSFMLSVKSDEEDIPVQAVRFLLPALLQLTTDSQGCNSLVKRGGHKFVVGYVQESARTNMMGVLRGGEDAHHGILEASDVLLNIFGNREGLKVHLDALDFAPLLAAMVGWSSASGTPPKQKATVMAMAACIIASVMELASEEELKKKLDLASYKRLPRTMKVIVAFLEQCHQATGGGAPEEERDLWDIVVTICTECMPQWPYLKRAFITSPWWEKLFGGKPVTAEFIQKVTKDPLLVELLAAAAVP
eukprot:jgi/Mesen1/10437/ME000082S09945